MRALLLQLITTGVTIGVHTVLALSIPLPRILCRAVPVYYFSLMVLTLLCASAKRFHPTGVRSFLGASRCGGMERNTLPTKFTVSEANRRNDCQWMDKFVTGRVALNIWLTCPRSVHARRQTCEQYASIAVCRLVHSAITHNPNTLTRVESSRSASSLSTFLVLFYFRSGDAYARRSRRTLIRGAFCRIAPRTPPRSE